MFYIKGGPSSEGKFQQPTWPLNKRHWIFVGSSFTSDSPKALDSGLGSVYILMTDFASTERTVALSTPTTWPVTEIHKIIINYSIN